MDCYLLLLTRQPDCLELWEVSSNQLWFELRKPSKNYQNKLKINIEDHLEHPPPWFTRQTARDICEDSRTLVASVHKTNNWTRTHSRSTNTFDKWLPLLFCKCKYANISSQSRFPFWAISQKKHFKTLFCSSGPIAGYLKLEILWLKDLTAWNAWIIKL